MGKTKLVLVASLLFTAAAFPQQSDKNAVGTWKLANTTSSTKPKSMLIKVTEDAPANVKYNFTLVSSDGKRSHGAYAGATDGQQHPITGDSPYKSASYTRDNGTIHATLTTQDGNTIAQDITISDDGKTMTIQDKSGDQSWTETYNRVGAGHKKAAKKAKQSGQ